MKKICMIVPKGLPVPAVNGGAIETLLNLLSDQNEKEKKLELTIISIYDKKAKQKAQKYKNTDFVFIKMNLHYILLSLLVKLKNKVSDKKLNTYNEICLNKIKRKKFDKIIIEAGAFDKFTHYLKYFKKEQMILHLHSHCRSDKRTDATFNSVIVPSDFIKKEWKQTSSIKKIYILKNCINFKSFDRHITESEKIKLKNKLGFKDEDFIIGYYGRIIPIKGVKEIIEAYLKIEGKNIKLLIVGSYNFNTNETSTYNEEINNLVKDSNERIKITGYVDNNELYRYLDIMDICVFSSICEEAAQITLIEAMANKKSNYKYQEWR